MSVYDAIYEAVAEREGVDIEDVRRELQHREIPADDFWAAWDSAVSDASELFCRVTGRTPAVKPR